MYSNMMKSVLLLVTFSGVLCYHVPVRGSGSYTLPSIGKYPAPQPTFPRNHGLPDAYKHFRTFRSVDSQLAEADDQIVEESAFEAPAEELYRPLRSVEQYIQEEPSFMDEQAEISRQRRSFGYNMIPPTFRPPPPRTTATATCQEPPRMTA